MINKEINNRETKTDNQETKTNKLDRKNNKQDRKTKKAESKDTKLSWLFCLPDNRLFSIIQRCHLLWLLIALACFLWTGKELSYLDYVDLTVVYPIVAMILFALLVVVDVRKFVWKNVSWFGYFLSAVVSAYIAYRIISLLNLNDFLPKNYFYLSFLFNTYTLFMLFNVLMAVGYRTIFATCFSMKQCRDALLVVLPIVFIILVYLPAESFFHNYVDYRFPYIILLKTFVVNFLFYVCVIPLFFSIMKPRVYDMLRFLMFGFLLGIYAQYMFLNRDIGIVDGSVFEWRNHIALVIVDTIVWLVLLSVPVLFGRRKSRLMNTVVTYIAVCLGLLHVVTWVTLMVSADEECYHYSAIYYSYEDQYHVATDSNIIVFIVDAADNSFMKQMMETEPEELEELKDFTIYTNTCSVYDYTSRSLLQMMTNVPFETELNNLDLRKMAWNLPGAKAYYERLHQAGYQVEFFNFDHEVSEYVLGNLDNVYSFNEEQGNVRYVDYKIIRRASLELVSYSVAPVIFKPYMSLRNASFNEVILYNTARGYEENKDFYEHLNLTLGEDDKYVLFQHIEGLHTPNDNMETMEYCMDIVKDYAHQMKELGVYDDATIIITADHGNHDTIQEERFAATPMFMIKQAGEKHDSFVTNDAPVYSTDLMATILTAVGEYDASSAEDQELFGTSIYEHYSGEQRERTWYDRYFDENYPKVGEYNTYYGYTYVGDTQELERCVEENDNLIIYPVAMQND